MTTENRTGHPVRTGLVAVAMVILLALVVFPGFVAAGLSREKPPMVTFVLIFSSTVTKGVAAPARPIGIFSCEGWPGAHAIFIPADGAMRMFPALARFYDWQYHLAGGRAGVLILGGATAI